VASVEQRLRALCLALPEAVEQETWEAPTFRVRVKIFAMMRHDEVWSVWLKAPPGAQEILVGADPARFFRPPYVGPKGWIGMRLGEGVDWEEAAALVRRSYRLIASKRLAAQVEG
jgi:predicted DNA-binding protein (MmcQ/YjbR family)